MKKLLLTFLLTFINISLINANYISNSVSIKENNSTSYLQNLSVWNWDLFDIRVNIITLNDSWNEKIISINWLPSWLIWESIVLESDTCDTKIKNENIDNWSLVFTFTPNNVWICESIVKWTFRVESSPSGTSNIAYTIIDNTANKLETSNNSVSLEINSWLIIRKAVSKDTDLDGFIDGYSLTFNEDIWANTLDLSETKIYNILENRNILSFTKTDDKTAEITFEDWVFWSWELPTIEINSTHNNYEKRIYNDILEDWAKPVLLNFNSENFTWDITSETSISSFIMNFSEKITDWAVNLFNIKVNNADITATKVLDTEKTTLTITDFLEVTDWEYLFPIASIFKDIVWNSIAQSDFKVSIVPPVVDNWGGWWWGGWGGWWWWWGGGWSSYVNYEVESRLSNKINLYSKITDFGKILYWKIKLDNSVNFGIDWKTLELKNNKKSKSSLYLVGENSVLNWEIWFEIVAPIQVETDDIFPEWVNIWWKDLLHRQVSAVYRIWDNKQKNLEKNFEAKVFSKRKSPNERILVYYNEDIEDINNFQKVWETVMDSDWIIEFEHNKFWYFAFVRWRYIDWIRYNWDSWNAGNINETLEIDENKVTNPALLKLAKSYYDKIINDDILYISQFDTNVNWKYYNYISALNKGFSAIDSFVKTRDSNLLPEIGKYWQVIQLALKESKKDILLDYIKKENKWDFVIYRAKNNAIDKVLYKYFEKYLEKAESRYEKNLITREKFDEFIENYNQIILNIVLFRENKSNKLLENIYKNFAIIAKI